MKYPKNLSCSFKNYLLDKMIVHRMKELVNRKNVFFSSVFFYDLNFKIVKVNGFDKIIVCEPGFAETFKVSDIFVKPDRFCEVELIAGFLQRMKDLVGACIGAVVRNADIPKQMVVFKDTCPKSKHDFPAFPCQNDVSVKLS